MQKNPNKNQGWHRNQGFSLIELMVALTIGLVISIAAMSAYLGSANASRISAAQARMDEDGQAALKILSQQIRLAGANPVQSARTTYPRNPVYSTTYVGGTDSAYPTPTPTSTYTMSGFAIRGCDGTFSNIGTATSLDSLTCAGTASTSPDSIAISYEADAYDTVKTAGGAATDCLGNALTSYTATAIAAGGANATFTVANNRFYIASANNVPSLNCKGIATANAQPLVENVEDMQLRYGAVVPSTPTPLTTDTIAGYRGAVDIEPFGTSVATAETNWGRVLTVRICVVVRSENPVVADANSGQYYKCDGSLDTSQTDLRMRRAYTTTVVLRNRKT